jgi:hypothetical protein
MTRYRTVSRLTSVDAAYIAGIIDGEGTITLTAMHREENRRLVIAISNTERALLEFIKGAIGAGRITNKRTYSQRHAPSYTYQIGARQALALLGQIAPYLRTYKSARADLLLRDYIRLTPRNGKYDLQTKLERKEFESKVLATVPMREGTKST